MEDQVITALSTLTFPVAWGEIGQGIKTPRAVIYRLSAVRDMHLQGTGPMTARIQIDCYGKNFTEALLASRQVRALLEGYAGGPIQGMFLNSVRDSADAGTTILHRISLDFSVHYNE